MITKEQIIELTGVDPEEMFGENWEKIINEIYVEEQVIKNIKEKNEKST